MDLPFSLPTISLSMQTLANAVEPLSAVADISTEQAIERGQSVSSQASRYGNMANQPISAAAKGIKLSPIQHAARFLSKALPIVTIGASVISGASIVQKDGWRGLYNTKEGRSSVLGAAGGALLLIPTPVTSVAAAGVLTVAVGNELGALKRFDRPASVADATTGATSTLRAA